MLDTDTLRCGAHGERTWWPAYWTNERPACWACGQPSDRVAFPNASSAQAYARRCRRMGYHAVVWRKGTSGFEVRFPS